MKISTAPVENIISVSREHGDAPARSAGAERQQQPAGCRMTAMPSDQATARGRSAG